MIIGDQLLKCLLTEQSLGNPWYCHIVLFLTRCVAAMVVLHAWGNVVLGGMFTYHSLTSLPGLKTCLLYLVEIVISCIAAMAVSRRNNCA